MTLYLHVNLICVYLYAVARHVLPGTIAYAMKVYDLHRPERTDGVYKRPVLTQFVAVYGAARVNGGVGVGPFISILPTHEPNR